MSRVLLPPLPRDFRGEILTPPDDVSPWAGASGPFWLPPTGVLRPGDADDVAAAVAWAGEEGIALVPRGGGTGMPGGNVSPNVVLDLSNLDRLDPVEPSQVGSPTLRAGAGATGAVLAERPVRERTVDIRHVAHRANAARTASTTAQRISTPRSSFIVAGVISWLITVISNLPEGPCSQAPNDTVL